MGIGPEIIVTLSPKLIRFTWKEKLTEFEPYVNIDTEKRVPVQIGKNENIPETTIIGVFDPECKLPSSEDKVPMLQMLFEYGIGKLFEQQHLPMLRPLVIVRGAESLCEILGGYQYAILATALAHANAREVRFE